MAKRRSSRSRGSTPTKLPPPRTSTGAVPRDSNYVMPQADKRGASLNPGVPGAPRIGDTVDAKTPLPGAFGSNINRGASTPVTRITVGDPQDSGIVEFAAPGAPPFPGESRNVTTIPGSAESNIVTLYTERNRKRSVKKITGGALVPVPYSNPRRDNPFSRDTVDAEFIDEGGNPKGKPLLPSSPEYKQLPPAVQDQILQDGVKGVQPWINDDGVVYGFFDTRTPGGRAAAVQDKLFQDTVQDVRAAEPPGSIVTPQADASIVVVRPDGGQVVYQPRPSRKLYGYRFIPIATTTDVEVDVKDRQPIVAQATATFEQEVETTGEQEDSGGRYYFGKGRLNFRRGK